MHFQREGGLLDVVVELIFLYSSKRCSSPWYKQRVSVCTICSGKGGSAGVGHRVVSRGSPLGSQLVGQPSIALSICPRRFLHSSISSDSPSLS